MSTGSAPIFLVSMPQMADPNFARTVVLLCDYTEEGAFGLVVNRRSGSTRTGGSVCTSCQAGSLI